MSLLKPVTPEEAKRAWVSIPNPSARRVAKALTQSGRRFITRPSPAGVPRTGGRWHIAYIRLTRRGRQLTC